MIRLCYLAEPIDRANNRDRAYGDSLALVLSDVGLMTYRPRTAWKVGDVEPGPEIEQVNRFVLAKADALVCVMAAEVRTIGVPREIEFAVNRGIPVGIWSPQGDLFSSWSLQDVRVFRTSDELVEWLKTAKNGAAAADHDSLPFQVLPGGTLPTRHYAGDAGFDLHASQDVTIRPGEFRDVPCGLRVALPGGIWGRITGRSSTLRKWGLLVVEGVIDSGYRGDLYSGLWNLNSHEVRIPYGSRLAQLILHANLAPGFVPTAVDQSSFEAIPSDGRESAGFGSTGGGS